MKRLLAGFAVVVLVLTLMSWAQAQPEQGGAQVFIDKDRNAVIQMEHNGSASGKGNASAKAGADYASGLGTLQLSVEIPPEQKAQLKDGILSLYSEIGEKNSMMLAQGKVTLPPDAKITATADAKFQQTDKLMHADAKFDFTVPNPQPDKLPFSKLSLDGASKTNFKDWSGKLNFSSTIPDVAKKVQMQSVRITLSDTVGKDNKVTTTLDLTATVDANSPPGQKIKQLGANTKQVADGIKGQLAMMLQLQVESVTISKAEANGNVATFAMTIKVVSLRDTLAGQLGRLLSRTGMDPNALKDALSGILEMQFDKLDIETKFDKDVVSGHIDVNARNLDKAMQGVFAIQQSIQEYSFKQMQERSHDKISSMGAKWMFAVQKKGNELNRLLYASLAANGANRTGSFAVNVEIKDKNLAINGNFLQDMTNVEKAFAELKQKGFPLTDRSGMLAHLKADGGSANGSLYATAQGNLVELMKGLLVEPAKAEPDLKPAADLASSVKLTDSKLSGELKDGKLEVKAYAQTSDLTAVASALQQQAAPKLQATPLGMRVEYSLAAGKDKGNVTVGFKQFMPGKSDDDVRAALSEAVHETFQIKSNAEATQTALQPKLDKPSVELAANLATVKSEGDSTLFPLVSLPGVGGGGASGPNFGMMLMIAVAVLVLLGLGMAASKKKP